MKTKQSSNRLDARIARAKTFDEKMRLVLYGNAEIPEGVRLLARTWRNIRELRAKKHRSPEFTAYVQSETKEAQNFIVSVLAGNRLDLLQALAQAMRHDEQEADWRIDKMRWLLVAASGGGKRAVNLSRLSRLAEANNIRDVDLRQWRRLARRLKVKTVAAGRPRK